MIKEKELIVKKDGKDILFKIKDVLGEGGYGKCYKLEDKDGNIYAGKFIDDKKNLKNDTEQFLIKRKKIYNEINIHKTINHHNIVKYIDSIEDSDYLLILLELCSKDLRKLLNEKKTLTELEVQNYLHQLINALIYLHGQNIIHRDLKPENIFITNKMEIKLGDFGVAKRVEEGKKEKDIEGTYHYMAPEVFENNYSYEADIWSLGIIMYELLFGELPFKGKDPKTLYQKLKENDYTFHENIPVSNVAKDLIKQILVRDPNKRPTLDLILQHDFFKLGNSLPLFKGEVTTTNLMNLKDEKDIINEEILNKIKCDIWIKKYLFKTKYGLGYILSNGQCGAILNDSKNLLLLKNQTSFIDTKDDDVFTDKRIEYLKSFKEELENGEDEEEEEEEKKEEEKPENENIVFLDKYLITKYCIFFFFNNKNWQIIFGDDTEILYNEEYKIISYINIRKERTDMFIEKIINKDNNFKKKYSYAKMIFNKEKEKAKLKQNL